MRRQLVLRATSMLWVDGYVRIQVERAFATVFLGVGRTCCLSNPGIICKSTPQMLRISWANEPARTSPTAGALPLLYSRHLLAKLKEEISAIAHSVGYTCQ